MTGDKLTITNWIERGDDVVIKQMRTIPFGFRENSKETAKVFVAYDKVLEIIDRAIDEDDKSAISWTAACKAIRRDVLALKGGEL